MLQLSLAAPGLAQQVTMETPLVSKRFISPDSGTPDRFDQTFKQRDNPLAPL